MMQGQNQGYGGHQQWHGGQGGGHHGGGGGYHGGGGSQSGRRPYNQGGHQGGRGGGFNNRRGGGQFGNSPYKPQHQQNPRGPISLITNNFKIKSQSNHSGIIYTYSVDFIDGENIETLQPMPMPTPAIQQQPEAAQQEEPS